MVSYIGSFGGILIVTVRARNCALAKTIRMCNRKMKDCPFYDKETMRNEHLRLINGSNMPS